MYLNDSLIRNACPGPAPKKLTDGDGLYLLLQPTGARWWRMRYSIHGKEKALSLGVYPEVSLKQARQKREEIRSKVANGVDPGKERKAERQALEVADCSLRVAVVAAGIRSLSRASICAVG